MIIQLDERIQTAVIHELFSGIQGEGAWVGVRQIFVRFHGCHVNCRYCDTPASRAAAPATCVIENAAGSRNMSSCANPLSPADLCAFVRRLQADYRHHSVSLTGGEPLLHGAFLEAWLPQLHAEGMRSYLETNGLLPAAIAALSPLPHYIAMDLKLPATAGIAPAWEEQATFLDTVLTRSTQEPVADLPLTDRIQVKIVFDGEDLAEIAQAATLVAACRRDIPCILQPVTPRSGGPAAPTPAAVLEAQRLAGEWLTDVRVIPQTHVMLGQW